MDLKQGQFYLSVSTPFGADTLLMRSMHGEEYVSRPFFFVLDMYSAQADLDFASIVGQSVTVSVGLPADQTRYVNGVVGRFVQGGTDGRFTLYHAEVHPWFWLLNKSSNSRIFQELSVPEIIEKVFGDLGYTDFSNKLTGTYAKRTYCVQYQESAFDFVSRLMEDEGIYYFFTHEDGKHTMVLADDADAMADCANAATVQYRSDMITWAEAAVATGVTLEQQVIPGKYAMDDFNFETPETDLKVTAEGEAAHSIYEYPGGFTETAKGEGRAGRRLEGYEAREKLLKGTCNTAALSAGSTFTLAGHPRADANDKWALEKVIHRAYPDEYHNEFQAFPGTSLYRPDRATPKPRIPGSQTAIVVGTSGEEIFTDKFGRIKVQFHWDQEGAKDEKSSCWIRVAQGWAGKAWGAMFLPRIGQEVVVSFLEGDPDQPLVTGSVYNATQTVPYALPDNMTRSTVKSNSSKGGGGYNELRFEDKKDSEEVWLHAQKDWNTVVEKNRSTTLNEEHDTLSIKKGNRTVTLDKGNLTTEMKKGTETHKVKSTRDLTVEGDESHTNKGDYTVKVDGDYTLEVGGSLTIKVTGDITIESDANVSQSAGSAFDLEAGSDLSADASSNMTLKAGSDLKAEGMNATIKATSALKGEGATAEIKGSGSAKVEGGMLDLKGSSMGTLDGGGMCNVKGGMIKLG
jgi:type VI secretion system secreted protein VgrG